MCVAVGRVGSQRGDGFPLGLGDLALSSVKSSQLGMHDADARQQLDGLPVAVDGARNVSGALEQAALDEQIVATPERVARRRRRLGRGLRDEHGGDEKCCGHNVILILSHSAARPTGGQNRGPPFAL